MEAFLLSDLMAIGFYRAGCGRLRVKQLDRRPNNFYLFQSQPLAVDKKRFIFI